jgi:hypothetical protein
MSTSSTGAPSPVDTGVAAGEPSSRVKLVGDRAGLGNKLPAQPPSSIGLAINNVRRFMARHLLRGPGSDAADRATSCWGCGLSARPGGEATSKADSVRTSDAPSRAMCRNPDAELHWQRLRRRPLPSRWPPRPRPPCARPPARRWRSAPGMAPAVRRPAPSDAPSLKHRQCRHAAHPAATPARAPGWRCRPASTFSAARLSASNMALRLFDTRSTLPSTLVSTFSSRAPSESLNGIVGGTRRRPATSAGEPALPPLSST